MSDQQALWDARYRAEDYLFGTEPNGYLAAQLHRLVPGQRALAVGDGEGRNAIWLARQGLDVTLVDISPVGIDKALRLARHQGCRITTVTADLTRWDWPRDQFDLAVEIFVHVPVADRRHIHRAMAASLKPGGLALVEAFRKGQADRASGGPRSAPLLYDADALAEDFGALETLELLEGTVLLAEGARHRGPAAVVRYLGRHP
ncbi:MAG TPA: class I SAM-dependent methyltransferase [Aliidongia sp.]|uniref:SAM-dependent methyltransferase n=1 Tax=Aliidongia sp. TaxID=1914230 RepID=UPI002DDD1178|nr:class I SAM-dependent methyltransferase [Aliidongia sp.]HEV2673937.1 class I SAM-dependent methyltransferase [Aliidongia sp.]